MLNSADLCVWIGIVMLVPCHIQLVVRMWLTLLVDISWIMQQWN